MQKTVTVATPIGCTRRELGSAAGSSSGTWRPASRSLNVRSVGELHTRWRSRECGAVRASRCPVPRSAATWSADLPLTASSPPHPPRVTLPARTFKIKPHRLQHLRLHSRLQTRKSPLKHTLRSTQHVLAFSVVFWDHLYCISGVNRFISARLDAAEIPGAHEQTYSGGSGGRL